MKKILALILAICALLCLASCAKGGTEGETTNNGGLEVIPLDTLDSSPDLNLDNKLKAEDGSIITTPSDHRIVDEVEDGYVIILMNTKYTQEIYKVLTFDSAEELNKFIVEITENGTAKDYIDLSVSGTNIYYKLSATDETYGKFLRMPREKVLEAFRSDSAVTDEHGHQH